MKKLPLLFIVLLLGTGTLFAQKGSISGILTDSSGKNPVSFATITVFQARDTNIVTYRLSDNQGRFRVPGLPVGQPLRAVITASGLQVIRQEFVIPADSADRDLGRITMEPDAKELEEVLVIAERPPVIYRKDTIEFNANAFKTLPTALVEDLLRKFPGVEVDSEGNITVNGRRANRMLVDSKEFFGTDPKVASRNLPANIIDRVQISEDREQIERNPDINPADVGVVINLRLKKSIRKGWFGKLYAGAGSNDRFETGGIVNTFRDTLQLSFLGYSNNLNRTAFSVDDVMRIGGFNRSGVNSVMVNSDGGFALNDISFGGMNTGIARSTAAGINANTLFKNNIKLSLQYFYGNNGTDVGSRTNIQQFFGDTIQNSFSQSLSNTANRSHRLSSFLEWKIDSLTTLTWRPSLQIRNTDGLTEAHSHIGNNFDETLNESSRNQASYTEGLSFTQELALSRRFRKKGRSLFASFHTDINNQGLEQINQSENIFYKIPTANIIDQLRAQDQRSGKNRLNVSYNDPISKNVQLAVWTMFEKFRDKNQVTTYDYDPASHQYVLLNDPLSNAVDRDGIRSTTSLGLRITRNKWTTNPVVMLRVLNIDNNFAKSDPIGQRLFFITPGLSLRNGTFNLTYAVNINEPQANDLQPAVNNVNPVYLQLGNPALKPSFGHQVHLSSFRFDPKTSLSRNVYINTTYTDNAIVRERTVDENGVQTTQPINKNGVWNVYISGSIRKQHKFNENWKLSYGVNGYARYDRSFVILNKTSSRSGRWEMGPAANWNFNWRDKIELSQRYVPSWNKSTYENDVYPELALWRHTATTDLVVRLPRRLVWESSIAYNYNPQAAEGIRKSVWLWNAAVNLLFFKEDKGQLKLSVYDILNQNINVFRTVRDNYIQDQETTILRRYVLLTFTYNIRNFGGKVGGEKQRFFLF